MTTQNQIAAWSRRYLTALRAHVEQGVASTLKRAKVLGRQAVALKLETLDVARLHAHAFLATTAPSGPLETGNGLLDRANTFFAETVMPIEKTHRAARSNELRLQRRFLTLQQRKEESQTSRRQLAQSVRRRRGAEEALTQSDSKSALLLADAQQRQRQLQDLAHTMLSAQEDERLRISQQLHEEIAQTLVGIQLQLLTMKQAARLVTAGIRKKIALLQPLLPDSVSSVKGAPPAGERDHET